MSQQVTSKLQTLLDSWDTSLENAFPAPLKEEVFFNSQGKALRVNKGSPSINRVKRAYFLELAAIFSFQAKLRHGQQDIVATESRGEAVIPYS